jgi:hypothetical protein
MRITSGHNCSGCVKRMSISLHHMATGWAASLREGFLDDIHGQYDKTTSYFDDLDPPLSYTNLMSCHFYLKLIARAKSTHQSVTAGEMQGYFDVLPDLYKAMAERGHSGTESQFTEAWATMIFRGICWNYCHSMVDGERVPARIWGSRLPVYIG